MINTYFLLTFFRVKFICHMGSVFRLYRVKLAWETKPRHFTSNLQAVLQFRPLKAFRMCQTARPPSFWPLLLPVLLPVLNTASLRYHPTIKVLLGLFIFFSINTP